jgi:hypothetical protein
MGYRQRIEQLQELMITKQLSKDPAEYENNVVQAIAAKRLLQEGAEISAGQNVSYVIQHGHDGSQKCALPSELINEPYNTTLRNTDSSHSTLSNYFCLTKTKQSSSNCHESLDPSPQYGSSSQDLPSYLLELPLVDHSAGVQPVSDLLHSGEGVKLDSYLSQVFFSPLLSVQ